MRTVLLRMRILDEGTPSHLQARANPAFRQVCLAEASCWVWFSCSCCLGRFPALQQLCSKQLPCPAADFRRGAADEGAAACAEA